MPLFKIGPLLGHDLTKYDMKIKRNISFKLRVYGKDNNLFQIRIRTTFNGNRLDLKSGCQINDREAWDEQAQLVKDGDDAEAFGRILSEFLNTEETV